MHFCCSEHKTLIVKAKSKRTLTRNYNRLTELSKQMGRAVTVNMKTGIKTFRRRISKPDLEAAVITGNYGSLLHTIPWQHMMNDLEPAYQDIGESYSVASDYTFKSLPAPIKNNLRYDTRNPEISRFINTRVGSLIESVTNDTQSLVQRAVTNHFNNAMTPRQVADTIVDHIGLNERQSIALMNYQSKLMDRIQQPYTPEKIDSLVSDYGDRLLNQRAMSIARSETRSAANYGQLSVWQQAQEQELIPPETKKVWIVDGEPCDICEPMDGIGIGLDDAWDLNTGESVDVPSDAHPNCMCGMEMDFG